MWYIILGETLPVVYASLALLSPPVKWSLMAVDILVCFWAGYGIYQAPKGTKKQAASKSFSWMIGFKVALICILRCTPLGGGGGDPEALKDVAMATLFFGFGTAFLKFQIPERLMPGCFDYVGSSHQFWHICVSIAAEFLYRAGHLDMVWLIKHQLSGSPITILSVMASLATGFSSLKQLVLPVINQITTRWLGFSISG